MRHLLGSIERLRPPLAREGKGRACVCLCRLLKRRQRPVRNRIVRRQAIAHEHFSLFQRRQRLRVRARFQHVCPAMRPNLAQQVLHEARQHLPAGQLLARLRHLRQGFLNRTRPDSLARHPARFQSTDQVGIVAPPLQSHLAHARIVRMDAVQHHIQPAPEEPAQPVVTNHLMRQHLARLLCGLQILRHQPHAPIVESALRIRRRSKRQVGHRLHHFHTRRIAHTLQRLAHHTAHAASGKGKAPTRRRARRFLAGKIGTAGRGVRKCPLDFREPFQYLLAETRLGADSGRIRFRTRKHRRRVFYVYRLNAVNRVRVLLARRLLHRHLHGKHAAIKHHWRNKAMNRRNRRLTVLVLVAMVKQSRLKQRIRIRNRHRVRPRIGRLLVRLLAGHLAQV